MQKPRFSMRLTSLMLVFIILFSMWSPSMFALGEKEQGEEEQDKPTQMEVSNEDEEDGSGEDQEEAVKEDPKEEEPEKEEVKEEPKKEEPKKEEKTQDENKEKEEELELEDIRLDNLPYNYSPGGSVPIKKFSPIKPISNSNFLRPTLRTNSLGGITSSKEAIPVQGMVNTWDIIVRVEGEEIVEERETVDIVLVIDTSGSMSDYSRMTKAKAAAINFVNQMADDYTKIAIVSFATGATIQQEPFINNKQTLTSKINGLSATGGTHTQAAILQAKELINTSIANQKYIVLLSDGEPTYSYEPKNWETVNETKNGMYGNVNRGTFNYNNRYGVYDGQYNNVRVGSGNTIKSSKTAYSSYWWPRISGNTEYYPLTRTGNIITGYQYYPHNMDYIDNGKAAIKAADDTKPFVNGLYTIAFAAGSAGEEILEDIASSGMYYQTDDQGNLNDIYDSIATSISTYLPFKDGFIIDEMGDGFSFVEMLSVSHGSILDPQVISASGSTNDKITWNIGSGTKDENSSTRYAEMIYRVEINDKILEQNGAKTDESQLFRTNKETKLNYKDANNQTNSKDITSPEVDPVLLKIKKILLGEDGQPLENDSRKFNVNIKKNQPKGYDHTETLNPNEDYVWLTSLRHEGNYNVNEISITGGGITNLNEFLISYQINGNDTQAFLVNHIGGIPRGDVDIIVTNQLIPQTVGIRIEKEVTGNYADYGRNFNFELTVPGENGAREFTLRDGEYKEYTDIPKNSTIKLKELLDASEDYEVTVKVGGSPVNPANDEYTIQVGTANITIEVTNHKETTVDTGISLDNLPYILVLALAGAVLGFMIIRRRKLHQ